MSLYNRLHLFLLDLLLVVGMATVCYSIPIQNTGSPLANSISQPTTTVNYESMAMDDEEYARYLQQLELQALESSMIRWTPNQNNVEDYHVVDLDDDDDDDNDAIQQRQLQTINQLGFLHDYEQAGAVPNGADLLNWRLRPDEQNNWSAWAVGSEAELHRIIDLIQQREASENNGWKLDPKNYIDKDVDLNYIIKLIETQNSILNDGDDDKVNGHKLETSENPNELTEHECSICYEQIDKCRLLMSKCQHPVHKDCAEKWSISVSI